MLRALDATVEFDHRLSESPIVRFDQRDPDLSECAKGLYRRGYDFTSIIIVADPVRDTLEHDSRYVRRQYELGPSEIRTESIKRLQGRYPTLDEIRKIIQRRGLPSRRNNFDATSMIPELTEKIYEAYELAQFPAILWERKMQFEDEFRSKKPDNQAGENKLRAEWRSEAMRLLMPTVKSTEQRVLNCPAPLDRWHPRNDWQQWFLADTGSELRFAIGGDGTQQHREQQTVWSTMFAHLVQQGHQIATLVYRYTDVNELKLERRYELFKTIDAGILNDTLFDRYRIGIRNGKILEERW